MIMTQTPFRIGLVGGGTDLPDFYMQAKKGGSVLNATINKNMYVIVKKRYDPKIRLGYSNIELVDSIDDLRHELIRESLKNTGITSGVEITTIADIPSSGSGLGSSGSLTVGLLNALWNLKGIQKSPESLAEEAFYIETTLCGKGVGKQDQYSAAFGGMNIFNFAPDGRVERLPVKLDVAIRYKINENFMLFYTGVSRDSTTILLDQMKEKEVLGLMSLLPENTANRLLFGDFQGFLESFQLGWKYKKSLSQKITPVEINRMIQKIEKVTDYYKVCGAGGGGYLLVYSENQEKIRSILRNYYELPFVFSNYGSRVVFKMND